MVGFEEIDDVDIPEARFERVIRGFTTQGYMLNGFTPPAEALARLRANSLIMAKKVTRRIEDGVKFQLLEGVRAGENINQLKARVSTVFDAEQPERIARSETNKAVNDGKLDSLASQGTQLVKVVANPDAESRCITLVDRTAVGIPPDEAHGLLPDHPNCRCTFAPKVAGL